MSDKTEKPTARRLERAREQGDSPVSAALSGGVGFVVALALLPALLGVGVNHSAALVRAALDHPQEPASPLELAAHVLAVSLPLLAAVALANAALGFAQTGGRLSSKRLALRLDRLNLFAGLKNLFTWQRAVGVLRGLVAAALVAWLSLRVLLEHARDLANSAGDLGACWLLVADLGKQLLWLAALIGLALGGIDLLVTRRAWLQRNRMSKDEVKREYRESEGDPEVRAARKRAHQEALTGASIGAVKTASVLVVNPTHLATALRYLEEEDPAPRVVAQGEGEVAKLMLDAARAYGIPIVRDVPVARALRDLEVGEEIPEALYEAVAEILREIAASEGGVAAEP